MELSKWSLSFYARQVIHMIKLHSKWASPSLLPKEFATYVKKQFTGGKVEDRQVKKSFLIGTKEL